MDFLHAPAEREQFDYKEKERPGLVFGGSRLGVRHFQFYPEVLGSVFKENNTNDEYGRP